MTNKNLLTNNKGLLTLDFVFASVIVFSFVTILFSFAMTFSVVEVIQYISFSSARNYSLAHRDQSQQRNRGQQKFDELSRHPVLSPLLSNGWFEVLPAQINDFNNEYSPDPAMDSDIFVGVRIPFSAPILYKRIPILGTTGSDPDAFTSNIQSFLAREPTFNECQTFIQQRAQQMQALQYNFDTNSVNVMMDNGC